MLKLIEIMIIVLIVILLLCGISTIEIILETSSYYSFVKILSKALSITIGIIAGNRIYLILKNG
ncbi:MAG: hypothetical protein ACRC92_21870 [Peptostreptococcaceae bacterium]